MLLLDVNVHGSLITSITRTFIVLAMESVDDHSMSMGIRIISWCYAGTGRDTAVAHYLHVSAVPSSLA